MHRSFGSCVFAVVVVATAGCASTRATKMHFDPRAGSGRTATAFDAEFQRSCAVGDCRRQAVEMRFPTGEKLRGVLVFHVRGSEAAGSLQLPSSGLPGTLGTNSTGGRTVERGAMNLVGDRSTRLGCEIQFTTGTRHGTGVCRASNGDVFDVRF